MTIGTALAGRGTVPTIVPPEDLVGAAGGRAAGCAGSFEHAGTIKHAHTRRCLTRLTPSRESFSVIDTSPAPARPRCRRDWVPPTAAASTSVPDRRRLRLP